MPSSALDSTLFHVSSSFSRRRVALREEDAWDALDMGTQRGLRRGYLAVPVVFFERPKRIRQDDGIHWLFGKYKWKDDESWLRVDGDKGE